MLELTNPVSLSTHHVVRLSPQSRSIACFIRICAALVLLLSMPRNMHGGLPESLTGFLGATMLLVMSFLYVTAGRTKMIAAAASIGLGLFVIGFSLASLVLQHS